MQQSESGLPKTPQQRYQYFHWLMLHGEPRQKKWSIGVQAPQLWMDYHEQRNHSIQLLLKLVSVLMPHRFEGTGFLDLWQTILTHVRTLPIAEQTPIWLAVFNPANQGDRIIPHSERIESILAHWRDAIIIAKVGKLAPATLESLVKAFGPTFAATPEWIIFAYGIDA